MVNYTKGQRVRPLSIGKIRRVAGTVRSALGVPGGQINMLRLFEHVLPSLIPGYDWEVRSMEEMGSDHGLTYPNHPMIVLREDVYENVANRMPRDRFTLAHEIGHVFLHRGEVVLARNSNPKVYECPEWQADTFAAEFLMPFEEATKCRSPAEIMERFNVSAAAAQRRYQKVRSVK